MRSFIAACIAAVLLAAVGALALNSVQEPVSVAFTTQSARP